MPRSGGEAEKLGNRYEGIFLAQCVLDLLEGNVTALVVESYDSFEAAGIELHRVHDDGHKDYWSVKRQRSKGPYTFAALLEAQPTLPHGIWGAAADKLCRAQDASFRFISQTVSNELLDLPTLAREYDSAEETVREVAARPLAAAYGRLRSAAGGDDQLVCTVLRRFHVAAVTEREAAQAVEVRTRRLILRTDGAQLDATALRLMLTDFVLDNLGGPISREDVRGFLEDSGYRIAAWRTKDLIDTLSHWNAPMLSRVRRTLVNGTMIERSEVESLLRFRDGPNRSAVVVGAAGVGKSGVLVDVVERSRLDGIPAALVHLDSLEPMTSRQLGTEMGLAESPALVLGNDGPAVLILDQVDALSIISGRNQGLRPLLHDLVEEASQAPGLKLILSCREFDIEVDDELRAIARAPGVTQVDVGPLDLDQVRAALLAAGVESTDLRGRQLEMLRVPRNLYLLLMTASDRRLSFESEVGLFDAYWLTMERQVRGRTGSGGFAEAVGYLADVMSRRESLSVPIEVFDGREAVRDALASESVVVIDNRRVAFFHESLLDYVVARTLAADDSPLVSWLMSLPEQSLFRRSQLRQVLQYRRATNLRLYLSDLESTLSDDRVRFHLKQLVLQLLRQQSPKPEEWHILERLLAATDQRMNWHILSVVRNSVAWFDLLLGLGVWQRWISGSSEDADRATTLLAMPDVTASRFDELASLLNLRVSDGPEWANRIGWLLCRVTVHRGALHSLFLDALIRGHLDGARPGVAINDDFWSLLYSDATAQPAFTARAIATWMRRQMAIAKDARSDADDPIERPWPSEHSQFIGHVVIESANRAPAEFANAVFPAMKEAIAAYGEGAFFRVHGRGYDINDLVPQGLELALRAQATSSPEELDTLLSGPPASEHEAFLRLAAWSANPERFWRNIVTLLVANPRYLTLGHQIGGFGQEDSGASLALRAVGPWVSDEWLAQLERLITTFRPKSERSGPLRGATTHRLLRLLPADRLSDDARRKLQELDRKFGQPQPDADIRISEWGSVTSPVPAHALAHMTDEQLIGAMLKYSEDGTVWRPDGSVVGGLHEFSNDVENLAKSEPARLLNVALSAPSHVQSEYLGRILRAVAQVEAESQLGLEEPIWNLVRHLFVMPDRPCGADVADALARLAGRQIPDDILLALAWYAAHDPDPAPGHDWLAGEDDLDDGDHQLWTLQSVRAHATWSLGAVLAHSPARADLVRDALDALCHDPVMSVRACLAQALAPTLAVTPSLAVERFRKLSDGAPRWFLGLPPVRQFVHHAIYYEYSAVRPLLVNALESGSTASVKTAASQIALAALVSEEAREDADAVRAATESARAAATEVYAANCFTAEHGLLCQEYLRAAFHDESTLVRKEAAEFSWRAEPAQLVSHEQLLSDFVESPAFGEDRIGTFLLRLADAASLPIRLMPLIGQRALEIVGEAGGDIRTGQSADAHTLAPLIFRAYNQATDVELRQQLLDIIDGMMELAWLGVDQALAASER